MVDYGASATEPYGPTHADGTVLAYLRHRAHEGYLEQGGRQDLTAHVNSTALEDHARAHGLAVLGQTTQDRFLIANGLLEAFESRDESQWGDPREVKRRLQAMQLIHPSAMGRRFRVLLMEKGLDPPPELAGLRDPFEPDRL